MDELRRLVTEFEGEFIDVDAENVAAGIIEFARTHQITFIVLGQSLRGRVDEILHGSIVNRIMRETRNTDVVIVAESDGP